MLNSGVLRLESVLVLAKICGKDYISWFFSLFSKMYFYCKIESVWVILDLILIWVRFSLIVFGIVSRGWDKNAGFSRLPGWFYSGLSVPVCHYLWKEPVADSGVASD